MHSITQWPSAIYTQQIPARGRMSGILLIKFYALHEWYNDVAPFLPPSLPCAHARGEDECNFEGIHFAEEKREREREGERGE
jgi:hypothetical protein